MESTPPALRPILLVDDDVELCALLGEFLHQHGFQVAFAHDGPSGLGRALSGTYELVILDAMLPLLEGFEVLRQLRRRSRVPVIMLTARAEERDRIGGLESGADDYLVKPFGTGELLARMRAVSRRIHGVSGERQREIRVGPVRIDAETATAWSGTRRLDLTGTEFAILDLLVREAGRIVSRDEISSVLNQRQATGYERSVDVHMSHLRKKLEPEAAALVRTARGIGYMFTRPE